MYLNPQDKESPGTLRSVTQNEIMEDICTKIRDGLKKKNLNAYVSSRITVHQKVIGWYQPTPNIALADFISAFLEDRKDKDIL